MARATSPSGLPSELQQEAFDLERDDLPQLRESTPTTPNLAKSEVVHVRLSQAELVQLRQAAGDSGRSVSDLIRGAVHRYLAEREVSGEVQDLILALHDRGLKLVPIPSTDS